MKATARGDRTEAEERLARVPFRALHGLAASLDRPLGEVLLGAPAEKVLDRYLRDHPALDREARAAVAEAIFGVGLWRRRLAWHAGLDEVAAEPSRATAADARSLLFALLRDLAGWEGREAARLLELEEGALPEPRPPPQALEVRASLPGWLARALGEELGEESVALAEALALPGPVALRPNLLRTTPGALRARLAALGVATLPGRLVPGALIVTSPRPNLYRLAAELAGWFEVQDEGSQLVGALLGARPGEAVLDLCAGAGGKALQLAALVGPGGAVHASDVDQERLGRLARRAARAGASGIVRVHGAIPPEDLLVDRVLVDAPCSELGALRRGPDARFRLDPASFAGLPALQRALVLRGLAHLRPGGVLAYATCTFPRAENEAVALAVEEAAPELERHRPDPARAPVTPEGFVRTWPHRHGCDGFFVALWHKHRRA